MAAANLTPKQRRLQSEIEEISKCVLMDYWDILRYPAGGRTTRLELIKRKMVRGDVVEKYTYIDELLAVIICHHFFRKPTKGRSFGGLWKTEKFREFNHYLLDDTYLFGKMRMVRAIGEIPAKIRECIDRINALRNAMAHSFFPENRREYFGKEGLMYRGSDIYTQDGVEKLAEDFREVRNYLWERAFGEKLEA